jgi:hypothetical protein
MNWKLLRVIFVIWLGAAIARVILGSSTSPAAYVCFALVWLLSAALIVVAIKVLLVADSKEMRIAALSMAVASAAVLIQGILGNKDTLPFTTTAFFASLLVLGFLYARMLRGGRSVES